MTPLDELKREMEARLPGVKAIIDAPSDPKKGGFLDLSLGPYNAVAEWEPEDDSFGICSLPSDGFNESDEVYDDVKSTAKRLVEVLRDGKRTQIPRDLLLNELRDKLGMSQEDLAKVMNVRQPTLSKMERRRDLLISSLRKIVEGLGGTLEISARFPRVLVQLVQFKEPQGGRSRSASRRRTPIRRKRAAGSR